MNKFCTFSAKAAIAAFCLLFCGACAQDSGLTLSGLDPENFKSECDGKQTALYTLKNSNGMEVCVTNFGGRLVSVMVPDRDEKMTDVILGFDNITDYRTNASDFGASIGRYANRISGASFVLDGETFNIDMNDGPNCLHGGAQGWQYKVYDAEQTSESTIVLTLNSPDGDMGFPGNVTVKVTYTLTEDNAIDISYTGVTDKPTVLNMTNHAYFNLSGNHAENGMDQILYINADSFTPADKVLIPTGEIVDVEGTPFDFRIPKPLSKDIDADVEQLVLGNGYDHNWVLSTGGDVSKLAVSLYSPATGILLEEYTDQPGVQVYSGNFLTGDVPGKHGIKYPRRASVCLETQLFPDSPNKPQWPSAVLRPGETYTHRCIYKFSVL